MGIVTQLSQNIMKVLLVIALAVAVHADADPYFSYAFGGLPYHGLGLPYASPLIHAPLVYAAAAGCQNAAGAVVPCALGGAYPGIQLVGAVAPPAAAPAAEGDGVVSIQKRDADAVADADADADPDADPWVYYSTHGYWPHGYSGYGYSHYAPHAYSYAPFTYASHYGYYGLGHHGLGYAYGRKKRDADAGADADADADADPYYLYGGYGYGGYGHLGYAGGHYGYGYHHALPYYLGHGCRNYLGGLVPCA